MKSVSEKVNFGLQEDVLFATDVKGVAIVNRKTNANLFLCYPEAAVWSVLAGNLSPAKSKQMLQAILGKPAKETACYIDQCMEKWRQLNLIR